MKREGLVIRSTGSWYEIADPEGKVHQGRLRGKFRSTIKGLSNPVAVGDKVMFVTESGEEHVVIEEILERENFIIRKSPRSRKHRHIIAANLDQAVLVATFSRPRTSLGFIDRFLINSNTYHIPSVIVFNKEDLLSEGEIRKQAELAELYQSLGYEVLLTSAKNGRGLNALAELLRDKVSLFIGHSGVGKSSLINSVEPGLGIKVKSVSASSGKGQHTTTFATMHPLSGGGWLVDTPGIREFGIVDLQPEEVALYFPEFAERLSHCKFHNCVHLHEPGCAVLGGLQEGEIAISRYESYLSILEDTSGKKHWD